MPIHPLQPTPFDGFKSATSISQTQTENEILNHILPWCSTSSNTAHLDSNQTDDSQSKSNNNNNNNNHFKPRSIDCILLARDAHVNFLGPLLHQLPRKWTVLDASRSWIIYWILGSFSLMDVKLTDSERHRTIDTIFSFQHPDGGFAGGPGHISHLAATFSCISSLAILLDNAPQSLVHHTWSRVNRHSLYRWLLSLKLPDGGIRVQLGGEIDVRGSYAFVIIGSLLNILTPELIHNVPEYLVNSQTHEGGMAATASRQTSTSATPIVPCPTAAPIGEAHGGYAQCALASYFMLQDLPSLIDSPKLDCQACLRWAVQMQALPIEGGGFRGRTNKLVDGCYAWWCGSLLPILGALTNSCTSNSAYVPDLFDRQALQEYCLLVSQDQPPAEIEGGLRDKPDMSPDMYHTYYVLAGLSIAQHHQSFSIDQTKFKPIEDLSGDFLGANEDPAVAKHRMKIAYQRALGWKTVDERKLIIGKPSNELIPIHPVFCIKHSAVKQTMDYFYHQLDEKS